MSGIQASGAVPARRSGIEVTDALKRGLDSAIANWPVLALRLVETLIVGAIGVATALALIVPLVISIGISAAGLQDTLRNADTASEVLATILAAHWLIVIYILVAISIALLVVILLHSFAIAGAARIFVDAEHAAGPAPPSRQRFAVFTFERWLAGGRQAWWPVFWIYNIAYGIAGIVILLPLLPFALLVAIFQDAKVAIAAGCLALIVFVFVCLVVLVVTNIVCLRAIIAAAGGRVDGTTALRQAWRAMRTDFGRHFAVAFIMMVLLFGGTGFLSMSSIGFAAPAMTHSYGSIMFMPVRILISFASSIFSAFVGNWFLASFAALSADGGRRDARV